MVFLPRIARALHHPVFAALLGLLLIGICVVGLVSGDISKVWAILIGAIGLLNVLRLARAPAEQTPPK